MVIVPMTMKLVWTPAFVLNLIRGIISYKLKKIQEWNFISVHLAWIELHTQINAQHLLHRAFLRIRVDHTKWILCLYLITVYISRSYQILIVINMTCNAHSSLIGASTHSSRALIIKCQSASQASQWWSKARCSLLHLCSIIIIIISLTALPGPVTSALFPPQQAGII